MERAKARKLRPKLLGAKFSLKFLQESVLQLEIFGRPRTPNSDPETNNKTEAEVFQTSNIVFFCDAKCV